MRLRKRIAWIGYDIKSVEAVVREMNESFNARREELTAKIAAIDEELEQLRSSLTAVISKPSARERTVPDTKQSGEKGIYVSQSEAGSYLQ